MRDRLISLIVYSFFALLVMALFYTQIVRYFHYSRMSKNNSIRIIPIDGPRGNIYDRNGKKLVSNKLCFDVAVIYQEMRDPEWFASYLSNALAIPKERVDAGLLKASRRPFAPITIIEDIDKDKAVMLEEDSINIRGLLIETRSRRDYCLGKTGCHVFGYLSEITEEELEELGEYGYKRKDLVGRSGIEKFYNRELAGVAGGTQVQVDSRGRPVRVLGLKEPTSGKDMVLTIDADIQAVCDKSLEGKTGAIVVIDPKTGEVLALASHPSFDPNVFVRSNTGKERMNLIGDRKGRPLSDRAISGLYPPGSVFKMVTSSAALETKKISSSTTFVCNGSYRLGRGKFDCWKEGGHGPQNIIDALMNSCNVFFYSAGRAAGVDALEYYSKLYGYGKVTGIDLPDEVKGIAPGRAWKKSVKKEGWYDGETLNYSIGQGYLAVTPIQVVCMTAVCANMGSHVRPHLVKKIGDENIPAPKPKWLGLKESTVRYIREGLLKVVSSEGGTGKRAKIEGVQVAGKTGTAQNPHGRTHAWFTGFAPFSEPTICVVVFLEHGGKGGLEPTEIAHDIFQEAKLRGYIK